MNSSLPLCTAAVAVLALTGCFGGEPDRTEELAFTETFERLEIRTNMGDIEVHADPDATETTAQARVYGKAAEVIAQVEDGTLVLEQRCPKRLRECGIDWVVTVPTADAERIFDAHTGSGDVDFFETHGMVIAQSGAGDIGLHDVSASDVDLETGSGDIGARVTGPLLSLSAQTGAGDITLEIPGGTYRLDLDTGVGDVSTRGISTDASAEAVVDAQTGVGDVKLRGG